MKALPICSIQVVFFISNTTFLKYILWFQIVIVKYDWLNMLYRLEICLDITLE